MENQSLVDAAFPLDCLNELVSHMRLQDLFKFSQVCKDFHAIIDKLFNFEANKNVNAITLTPSSVVCHSFIPIKFPRPIEHSVIFSDHILTSSRSLYTGIFYVIQCVDLHLMIDAEYQPDLRIYHREFGWDMVRLRYDANGVLVPHIIENCLPSERYYDKLPLILECIEELRVWKKYCDRK